MRKLVLEPTKEAAKDSVNPFRGTGTAQKEVYWVGPYTCGPVFVALHGPLQLVFIVLAVLSIVCLVLELRRSEEVDVVRTISGVLLILVCLYLVYLGKAVYVLKAFRKEIVEFRYLNRELRGEVGKLECENAEYDRQNREHARLNQELSDQVKGLGHVEEKLSALSADCNGSVSEVRELLGRLDRFVRLNTVNSVFQFFDRSDRNRNGKVDGNEVNAFVDSISVLWRHLPHFKPDRMKAEIVEQGGMSLQQVHRLVDLMLLEEAGNENLSMTGKLELIFAKEAGPPEDKAEEGSCPGAVVADP